MSDPLAKTDHNKILVSCLKEVKETDWVGNTTHPTLDKALRGLCLNSHNSGWYNPAPFTINGLKGIFIANEDKTLFYSYRIIKENDNNFRIETLTMSAYRDFEKSYCEKAH